MQCPIASTSVGLPIGRLPWWDIYLFPISMVHLSDKSIAEFQAIYKAETGKDITHEQTIKYGTRFIRLVDIPGGPRIQVTPQHEKE
jgi:hypothetical protein